MQDLLDAARVLDGDAVARLVCALSAERGVAAAWTGACVPALRRVAGGRGGADIAVEHTLSAGIARGLHLAGVLRYADVRGNHVLLVCAPREAHDLPLRALAAVLAEQRTGTFPLGADVPWPALHAAVTRTGARTAVVWAQTADTADTTGLSDMADSFPDTRVVAAGPGWTAARATQRLTRSGIVHVTSLGAAVAACTRVDQQY